MTTDAASVWTAAAHAVAVAVERHLGSRALALTEFPFLEEFYEPPPPVASPRLQRLTRANRLDDSSACLFTVIGLIEEDSRFGVVFEALQHGTRRPTHGLLTRLFPDSRVALRRLQTVGLVRVIDATVPRADAALEVPPVILDVLLGGDMPTWMMPRVRDSVPSLANLVLPPPLRRQVVRWLRRPGDVLVRGPAHNGRATLLAAMAHASGRDAVEFALQPSDERVACVGHLAAMSDSMPVWRLDPAPGETLRVARPPGLVGPCGLVMPRHGGLDGDFVDELTVLNVPMPSATERQRIWRRWTTAPRARQLAGELRLTSGNTARVASTAFRDGGASSRIDLDAVRAVARAVHRAGLDQLATSLAPVDPSDLVVVASVRAEIEGLIARCRLRERLRVGLGPALQQLGCGVRALFAGASGTGKTLAARAVAGSLGLDLYRLDLSAVINKYIGETEKNLERVFAMAEQLDVILLLDEGDALMARRTAVGSAIDRYANLETNFLLQRLETYEGIVFVTSNASDRIDPAFARRMDVVIDFMMPDIAERLRILQRHVPEALAKDPGLEALADAARLSGAQLRNAVIHAAVLAGDAAVALSHLRAGLAREFTKMGAPCPLGGA